MITSSRTELKSLSPRQRKGRAINAVAELLRKKLSVPNIYLQPHLSKAHVDVLAVDRAGAGDLHAIQIKLKLGENFERPEDLNQMARSWMSFIRDAVKNTRSELMALPAHYRYLAIPHESLSLLVGEIGPHLYSPDGIGRIGIIGIIDQEEEPPKAEISIIPERFRVDPAKLGKIEKTLLDKVRPDIEVRI
jgi:hypothetical protein